MKTVIEMADKVFERMPPDKHCREMYWTATKEELERFAELVRADDREAMVALSAKQGWAMKNEEPFEDCVREIAAIRARSNT